MLPMDAVGIREGEGPAALRELLRCLPIADGVESYE